MYIDTGYWYLAYINNLKEHTLPNKTTTNKELGKKCLALFTEVLPLIRVGLNTSFNAVLMNMLMQH